MSGATPSFHPSPGKPKHRLPEGACDAHVHVFGPSGAFPYAGDAPFVPADAPKEALFAMHAHLGIEHCVIVQSTCHGHDNRAVEDALRAKNGSYCGIALVPLSISDGELRRLDGLGFRGVRFNFMRHLGAGPTIDEVIAFGARLAPLEWHLQLHFESALIHEIAPWLRKSPVPVVVDHMGRVDASRGIDQPDFRALLDLMEDRRILVKVSGPERCSKYAAPYPDAIPFAARLVAEFGNRAFWGTDWPHPNLNHVPDDGQLADLLWEIAPSEAQRQALLVDNPRRFYRYLPATA